MWHLVFVLSALTNSWWVVKGYHYPPILLSGPYRDVTACQESASEWNRVELTWIYHCENH